MAEKGFILPQFLSSPDDVWLRREGEDFDPKRVRRLMALQAIHPSTLAGLFCRVARRQALEQSKPGIFNTDQEAQFIATLEVADIRIRMDGRGQTLDNAFVERLWRTAVFRQAGLLPSAPKARSELLLEVLETLAALPEGPILDEATDAIRAVTRQAYSRAQGGATRDEQDL